MDRPPNSKVPCPGCGREYRWRPNAAGKRVECGRCGERFRMPDRPPPPDDDPADTDEVASDAGGYELDLPADAAASAAPPTKPAAAKAADGRCPGCGSAVKANAVICLNCGMNLRTGERMQTALGGEGPKPGDATEADEAQRQERRREFDEQVEADMARRHRWTERDRPLLLIGIGLALTAVNVFYLGPEAAAAHIFSQAYGAPPYWTSVTITAVWAAVKLAIQVPLLFATLFLVAYIFGTAFGPIGTAVLKLLALVLIVTAIGSATDYGLDIVTGGFGGIGFLLKWSIVAGVFFALAMPLYDLDVLEATVMFLIMIFAPGLIMIALLPVIYSLFA